MSLFSRISHLWAKKKEYKEDGPGFYLRVEVAHPALDKNVVEFFGPFPTRQALQERYAELAANPELRRKLSGARLSFASTFAESRAEAKKHEVPPSAFDLSAFWVLQIEYSNGTTLMSPFPSEQAAKDGERRLYESADSVGLPRTSVRTKIIPPKPVNLQA